MKKHKNYVLSLGVFLFVILILGAIQVHVETKLLILERFFPGGGWFEIVLIAFYSAFLFRKMKDPRKVSYWRRMSWSIFSIVFFLQLIMGISGLDKFLMIGELHLPVPAMIISGPIYRGEFSIMTFLFLSTIILTGPAWCSHLCYFGGIDNLVAGKNTNHASWQNKRRIKHIFFIITLLATFIFRLFHISSFYALAGGILAGVTGVLFMIFGSTRSGKMANCVLYCPVGTLVSYIKYVNPFRMKIQSSCTLCGKCSSVCRYDALNQQDIEKGRPGMTCTYCGDCIAACNQGALNYKFFNLSPTSSRNLYLFLTVSFHVVFLALARI